MSYIAVGCAALLVSGLTLFSGFGLGTLLMPVLALFFPLEMAVAATAVVHIANSLLKVAVVGRHADFPLVVRFGVPAIPAALAGAAVLAIMSGRDALLSYELAGRTAMVTPLKLVMAGLMLVFALAELLPRLRRLTFDRRYLILGGLLSGFFGGLSGHQGALRAAFLTRVSVSAQAFVGTSAVIGFMVDLTRIVGYFAIFFAGRTTSPIRPEQWPLIGVAILASLAGVLIGKRFLRKITMPTVQTVTGLLLLLIALVLGIGLI